MKNKQCYLPIFSGFTSKGKFGFAQRCVDPQKGVWIRKGVCVDSQRNVWIRKRVYVCVDMHTSHLIDQHLYLPTYLSRS